MLPASGRAPGSLNCCFLGQNMSSRIISLLARPLSAPLLIFGRFFREQVIYYTSQAVSPKGFVAVYPAPTQPAACQTVTIIPISGFWFAARAKTTPSTCFLSDQAAESCLPSVLGPPTPLPLVCAAGATT